MGHPLFRPAAPSRRTLPLCAAALLGLVAPPLGAQGTARDSAQATAKDSTRAEAPRRPVASCDGLIVSEIAVDARKPETGGIYDRLPALGRTRREIHITTRESVIRRFLALKEGEPCTELRRFESARILRAQPFIADAKVIATDDGAGGVRIDVTTIDELSIVVGGSVSGGGSPGLQKVKLGTLNLRGTAISVVGEWQQGFVYRDGWGLKVTDYQALGRPYQLSLGGMRHQLGHDWEGEVMHPFFTDLQRAAWRVTTGEVDGYVQFLRGDTLPASSLTVLRRYLDIGGIVRVGEPGRLSLFGLSLSRERESVGELPVIVTDSGLVADTSPELVRRYGRHRTARINALWGVRNVTFMRVYGFDALSATQDVRTGFQLGTLFGRGLSAAGSHDDDIFVSTDLYGGWGTPRSFLAFQVQGEGRQDYDVNHWDGVLASGRAAWYFRPAVRQTTIASVEYGGGWRQRTPFQLALGNDEGGVRGYRGSNAVGGQRLVSRLEHHWIFPRLVPKASTGLALFSDAGKMWKGDVPWGRTSRVNASAGLGILASLPSSSRRVWRLDLAVPFGPDRDGRWVLRLTSNDLTRVFWKEPPDLARGRERATPTSIFSWP